MKEENLKRALQIKDEVETIDANIYAVEMDATSVSTLTKGKDSVTISDTIIDEIRKAKAVGAKSTKRKLYEIKNRLQKEFDKL